MINNQEEQRKYDVLNNSYTNIHAFKSIMFMNIKILMSKYMNQ